MTHNTITKTPQEQLIRENEILSKTVLEILLRFSEKVSWSWKEKRTDERIKEILSQPDWKEKTQFIAKDYWNHNGEYKGECIGHWWSAPWLVDAREPIEIIKSLKKEKEEVETEWVEENIKLRETIKKLEESNLWLQRELKEAWSEGDTHIEAMKFAGELAEGEIKKEQGEKQMFIKQLEKANEESQIKVQNLEKQVSDKEETLEVNRKLLSEEKEKNKELQKKLEESLEMLEEVRKNLRDEKVKSQGYKNLLHLNTKSLPKIPNKLKVFKQKAKTKLQNLVEKTKHKSQELVARIEVRVK